jgi:hypothetical protein
MLSGESAVEAMWLPFAMQRRGCTRRVFSRLLAMPINSRDLRALFNERILMFSIGGYAQNINDS